MKQICCDTAMSFELDQRINENTEGIIIRPPFYKLIFGTKSFIPLRRALGSDTFHMKCDEERQTRVDVSLPFAMNSIIVGSLWFKIYATLTPKRWHHIM